MKRGSTRFLQAILILIGISVLALMLWEPHLEGRNINATLFDIYFHDPFLAYVYLGSIAFFVALYQGFTLLGYIEKNKVFSRESVKALRTIKYCALTLIGFILGAEGYLFIVMRGKDDIAGGVAVGLMMIAVSSIIAATAAVFEKLLQNATELKSEHDLTV